MQQEETIEQYFKRWLKNIIIVFTLIVILIFTIGSATSLILQPKSFDINVTEFQEFNYSLELTYVNNTLFNMTLYNITIQKIPHTTFHPISNISLNQSKPLNFTIKTNTTLDTQYVPKLTFFYLTKSKRTPVIKTIIINQSGFTPFNIKIFQNDILRFLNLDIIDHTITNIANSQETDIEINQTHNITFPTIGNFTFADEQTLAGLNIEVLNNSFLQPTQNPSWFIPVTFKIKSIHQPGALQIQLTTPERSIRYNELAKGVLILDSEHPIFNLKLQADDWITFPKNNFNLDGQEAIIFDIRPTNITKTNQTGRIYQKEIKFIADNIQTQSINFSISIESANITAINQAGDNVRFVDRPLTPEETIDYCFDQYGDDLDDWEGLCKGIHVNITRTEFIERAINASINERTLIDFLERDSREEADTTKIKTAVETTSEQERIETQALKSAIENNTKNIESAVQKINQVHDLTVTEKQEKNANTLVRTAIFIMVGLLISLAGLGAMKKTKRLKKLKRRTA